MATQRLLDATLGFDDVLRAVRPFSDFLPDLPRQMGELQAQLCSAEVELAAAKRAVASKMMARETAGELLNMTSAKPESLKKELKCVMTTNICVDVFLEKPKAFIETPRKT
ncbi:hypothetical protein PInf_005484 [Phytophthora infestans]|nr:hypothetical protein PInf_005484 [Phytophthora infestans]